MIHNIHLFQTILVSEKFVLLQIRANYLTMTRDYPLGNLIKCLKLAHSQQIGFGRMQKLATLLQSQGAAIPKTKDI